ncbi:MAG: FGGY family carbohydrate kinase, partial [Micropruina sp.]
MEAQRVIIGLDVGTTAVKAVAFGLGSSRRASAAREYPLIQPQAGWQVQDPQRIAAAVVSALAECVAACGDAQVLAVSLSTAMHGLIGLDADGRPMTPLVTWADGRALA